MKNIYLKINDILNEDERRHAMVLFGMMLIMGLLEAIGIISVMPFIAVVANPDIIETNRYLAAVFAWFGFTSNNHFLIFLGLMVFTLVVGGLAFKALTYWAMVRFTQMKNYSISSRLLAGYLSQPYEWFLNRHSAELGKTLITEVLQVVNSILIPGIQLIASSITAAFIFLLVIGVAPKVAFVAFVIFGSIYGLIYFLVRKRLHKLGMKRSVANQKRIRVAQEALSSIKDLKVLGLESVYLKAFKTPALQFSTSQVKFMVIGQLPRFFLEALVFGGMLILLLVLLAFNKGNLNAILPLIGLYAFAGTRLIPALQQIYQALSKLRFGVAALEELHRDLAQFQKTERPVRYSKREKQSRPLRLVKTLKFKNVSYRYPGAETATLTGIDFTVPAKSTVALVGRSGAGKTTVIDLLLGLLTSSDGVIEVDETIIDVETIPLWQKNTGYVPQQVSLIDESVAYNIGLGAGHNDIDRAAVIKAAQTADLHDFIVNELPEGYDTLIGERGVRLSGGQRQRIGIARALYHDPDVLVLDEATSALDHITEKVIVDAIKALGHQKTIIIVAHRLSTIQHCDQIFLMEAGRIIDRGCYQALLETNSNFQRYLTPTS